MNKTRVGEAANLIKADLPCFFLYLFKGKNAFHIGCLVKKSDKSNSFDMKN